MNVVWIGRPEFGRLAYFRWNLGMKLYLSHKEGESKPFQWAKSRNIQLGPGRLGPISKRDANLGHDQVFNIHPIQDWSMAREECVSAMKDWEAAQPKRTSIDQTTWRTDSWRRSRPSHGKAVPRGGRARLPGPTFQRLKLSFGANVKHNRHNCIQLTLGQIPTSSIYK